MKQALLELTTNCNKNCKFCYNRYDKNSLGNEISFNNLSLIKSKLETIGVKNIVFSGGEPLIYSHLEKAIRLFKDFNITIITNGYNLNKNWISFFKKESINLRITLDLTEKYDDIFNIINENEFVDNVIFQITVYDEELKLLQYFLTNWHNKYHLPLEINYSMFKGKATKHDAIVNNYVDLSKFIIMRTLMDNFKMYGQYTSLILSNYLNEEKQRNGIDCSICDIIKININGEIYPCPFMTESSYICGNIYKSDMDEVTINMNTVKSNLIKKRKDFCDDCKWIHDCKGGCLVESPRTVCGINKSLYNFVDSILSK